LFIDRLEVSEGQNPTYFIDDSSWQDYSFTLEGHPWSDEYEYYFGKERPSRNTLSCKMGQCDCCWVWGSKWDSFSLFAGETPN
ncbi:MAG: hypothetical protein AAF206_14895, partial [Bacteroidota bacterium]